MHMHNRKQSEAAIRYAERKRREDEAPRLSSEVPSLKSLRLEIEERSGGSLVAEPVHVKLIVVAHAPALFFLPCGDSRCRDGGHDVTHSVLRSLQSKDTQFEGQDVCSGSQGSGQCSRVLHYIAIATYE
jgi:hypothetical protein